MTILYEVHDNLYVNLTNKCPCACAFCLRNNKDQMNNSGSLWLKRDVTFKEAVAEIQKFDMDTYKELVFCGFGEPAEALEVLLEFARYVKEHYKNPIRMNTNGLGNLIHGRNIVPEMKGLIDTVSISLNTPDAEEYHQLVRSKFGEQSFEAVLAFAEECTKYIPQVIMTTVATTITPEEELQCREICDKIGVSYRIRQME